MAVSFIFSAAETTTSSRIIVDARRVPLRDRFFAFEDPVSSWRTSVAGPTMFHVLMRDATFDPSRFRSLRSGIIAGGSVSEILADRGRVWCDVEIVYGLPDIGPTVSDVDAVTRRPPAPDGCCLSGAVGIIAEDGYVRIVGRRRDTILRGGLEIRPREVNEQLRAYPVVDDRCVTGIPQDILGERVCAWIVTVPVLARFGIPRPMTGSGPLKRRAFEREPALDHTAIIGSS